jgi:hypothetical protein
MSACGLGRRKVGEHVRRHEQQGVHGRKNDLPHREVRDLIVRGFDQSKVVGDTRTLRGVGASKEDRIRKSAPARDTAMLGAKSEQRLRTLESPQGERAKAPPSSKHPKGDEPANPSKSGHGRDRACCVSRSHPVLERDP